MLYGYGYLGERSNKIVGQNIIVSWPDMFIWENV